MAKVLVTDSLATQGLEILENAEGIEVVNSPGLSPGELLDAIADADALVIRSGTKVTKDVIAAATQLKVVGRAGIGVDNVDVGAATSRGIVVMNTPGGNTITTAEHAISLMVSLARHIPQATASMKAGQWNKKAFTGKELYNCTLGVIGLGNIGRIVADRARGLGMKVIAHDPFISGIHVEPGRVRAGFRSTTCSQAPTSSRCTYRRPRRPSVCSGRRRSRR